MNITKDQILNVDMIQRCFKVNTSAGMLEIDIPDEMYNGFLETMATCANEKLYQLAQSYYRTPTPHKGSTMPA